MDSRWNNQGGRARSAGRLPSALPQAALLLATLFCCLGPALKLNAQAQSDDQVKAAYLFNFARLVEWPAVAQSSAESPITFCLLGRSRVAEELESSVGDNKIAGRPLRIRHLQNGDDLAGCHLLFIAGSAGRQQEKAILQARGKPILLVGETPGFTNLGGNIGFVQEGGRIGFEVNLAASEQSNLRISARLLSIARSVTHRSN
jgi:hypothetical protein